MTESCSNMEAWCWKEARKATWRFRIRVASLTKRLGKPSGKDLSHQLCVSRWGVERGCSEYASPLSSCFWCNNWSDQGVRLRKQYSVLRAIPFTVLWRYVCSSSEQDTVERSLRPANATKLYLWAGWGNSLRQWLHFWEVEKQAVLLEVVWKFLKLHHNVES